MRRREPGPEGVVLYERVPIHVSFDQHARFLLHVVGVPRDQPSHTIRVFLNDPTAHHKTAAERASHAADYMTYNSPPPKGPERPASAGGPLPEEQGDYEILVDVSEAMTSIAPTASEVDVTLVMVDLDGNPMQASDFHFSALSISRRA